MTVWSDSKKILSVPVPTAPPPEIATSTVDELALYLTVLPTPIKLIAVIIPVVCETPADMIPTLKPLKAVTIPVVKMLS